MTRYRDDRYDDRFDMRDDRRSGDMRDRNDTYREDRGGGERYLYADRSGMGQDHDRGDDRGYNQRQGYQSYGDRSGMGQGYGQQGYGRESGDMGSGMNRDRGMSGGYRDEDRSYGMSDRGGSQGYGGSVRAYRQDYGQRQMDRGDRGMSGGMSGGMGYGDMGSGGMGGQYGDQSQGYQEGRSGQDSRLVYGAELGSSGYSQGQRYGQGQGYSSSGMGMSDMGMGSHRGKGPKGYQRSDDRIREEVSDALQDAHDVDASNIEVQVQNGEVTLTGMVDDRQQKRRAEDCAERVRGVHDVQNQLRVQRGDMGMGGTGAGGVAGTTDMGRTDSTVNRTGDTGTSSTGETPMGSLGSGARDTTSGTSRNKR